MTPSLVFISCTDKASGTAGNSTSATKVAADLIKQKGIGAVYKGLGATLAR